MPFQVENVVLVANQINPTIATQPWLIRNGIIDEADLASGGLFAPPIVQLSTQRFDLMVAPDRVQVNLKGEDDSLKSAMVKDKIVAFARALPETPYNAAGCNFIWNGKKLENAGEQTAQWFLSGNNPVASDFPIESSRFGSFCRTNIDEYRLTLTINPFAARDGKKVAESIVYSFNFNLDLPSSKAVPLIEKFFERWKDMKARAVAMLGKFGECE